jgi:hypothetical protein
VLSCVTDRLSFAGSGELEFEEFVTLAGRFLVEEDAEAMQQELREAFRLYDKEGKFSDPVRLLLLLLLLLLLYRFAVRTEIKFMYNIGFCAATV